MHYFLHPATAPFSYSGRSRSSTRLALSSFRAVHRAMQMYLHPHPLSQPPIYFQVFFLTHFPSHRLFFHLFHHVVFLALYLRHSTVDISSYWFPPTSFHNSSTTTPHLITTCRSLNYSWKSFSVNFLTSCRYFIFLVSIPVSSECSFNPALNTVLLVIFPDIRVFC